MPKLGGNRDRDITVTDQLHGLGWSVAIVWQCETKNVGLLADRLAGFLGPPSRPKRCPSNAALAPETPLVVG